MARRRPRHQPRNPFVIGLSPRRAPAAALPRLHQGRPVHARLPLDAVFESANSLRQGSPVRIAGVNVGKVVGRRARGRRRRGARGDGDRRPGTARSTPTRRRRSARGSSSRATSSSTCGRARRARPCCTTATRCASRRPRRRSSSTRCSPRCSPTRGRTCKDVLAAVAAAWTGGRPPAQDRAADPPRAASPRPRRSTTPTATSAPPSAATALVNEALLGTQPRRDLARLIARRRRATAAGLARDEVQLRELIGNFNTTAGALAGEQRGAAAPRVRRARPDAAAGEQRARRRSTPRSRRRARARARSCPASRETAGDHRRRPPVDPPGARAARAGRAAGPRRATSRRSARDLARLTEESLALLPQTTAAARCARDVVLPTGDVAIQDEFATGRENYKEFFYALVGLAGEGQNFDGNGQYVRFQTGGGDHVIRLGRSGTGGPPQFGALPVPQLGTRPALPGHAAALPAGRAVRRPAAPRPQRPRGGAGTGLDGAGADGERDEGDPQAPGRRGGDPRPRRRRGRRRGGHPRQPAAHPARLGAVRRPRRHGGRGGAVERPGGHAGPGPGGQRGRRARWARSRASGSRAGARSSRCGSTARTCRSTGTPPCCCGRRPACATWSPSSRPARAPPGGCAPVERIPIGQTLPDVNLDEILAGLDADTRTYLRLLLGDAAGGLRGTGPAAGRHAAPLRADGARPAARQRRARAARRHLARAIHDFSLLAGELGGQGRRARHVRELLQRRPRLARAPGREPARDAPRAPRRIGGHAPGAGARAGARRGARPHAAGAAARGARARAVAAADAAVPGADDARDPRADPAVRAGDRTDGAGAAAGRARPRRRGARPHPLAHCGERAARRARLQPAGRRTRATCSGSPGSTTSPTPCWATPTRTAPCAAVSSW